MRLALTIVMLLGLVPGLTAQGPIYHWYHADSLLFVDKPDGLEVLRKVPLYGNEAQSTYTTPAGDLLYYTNGVLVYNREDSGILNTESLLSSGYAYGGTTISQGALFLPKPRDMDERYTYVLLHIRVDSFNGYCFSLIDANLDGGLGGIVDTVMNVPFSRETTEQLHAVQHENGQDWWIYTRSSSLDSASYIRRTLLDSAGLHSYPPINIGVYAPSPTQGGEIFSSPNGCFLAEIGNVLTSGGWNSHVAIFDLCRSTGDIVLKQFINFPNLCYIGAFSPNSELLYVGSFYSMPPKIVQISFMDSLVNIETVYAAQNANFSIGEIELSRDGRVYFGVQAVGPFLYDSANYHLGAIKSPDLIGVDCDVDPFFLNLGKRLTRPWLTDLPNYVLSATPCPCDSGGVEPPDTTGTWLTNYVVDKSFVTPTFSTGMFFLADWVHPGGELSVYSITGRLEFYESIKVNRLDLDHLPEGMYFVELIQEGRRYVQRIFISK